jgi:predicted anti-sigma-YlaC factor YlaD
LDGTPDAATRGFDVVTCQQCREAVSARFDGEDPGTAEEALDAHLVTCRSCRRFAARVRALGQALPVVDDPVPDRAAHVMVAVQRQRPVVARRRATTGWVGAPGRVARAGLALIAVVQLVAALVSLSIGRVPHSAREVGAFQIALAVGFLVAAVRPATAAGLLPTAAAMVLCLVGVVVADVATGQTAVPRELAHATEVAGVALLWLVTRDHPGQRRERKPAGAPGAQVQRA